MITLRPHQQRGLDALDTNNKGQVIVPTGGGKTLIAIMDAQREVEKQPSTIVVVCPRILLAEQLCSEFREVITSSYVHVMHVHSGETSHFSSTKPQQIHQFVDIARSVGESVIIFTTYHSLQRVQDADIEVNTIYFDEAHNSVQRNFFGPTEFFSHDADRCYFFTATRKTSVTVNMHHMNIGTGDNLTELRTELFSKKNTRTHNNNGLWFFDHFQVGDCVLNHTNSLAATRRNDDLTFVVVPHCIDCTLLMGTESDHYEVSGYTMGTVWR